MEIFGIRYRPFTMGGSTHQPIKCDVPVDGPHDLGKGYLGYLATATDGRSYVVEATGGGIIGTSLDEVRKDVAQGDPKTMNAQIAAAQKDRETATLIDPERFWAGFRL